MMTGQIIRDATASRCPQMGLIADALEGGRAWVDGQTIWLKNLLYEEQCALLGLAARYPDHVHALVTHDLNSGQIKNLGDLISTIRIGE